MKKTIEMVLQKGNTLVLDQGVVNELGIKEGEGITLEYECLPLGKCCFTVESIEDTQMQEEGCFCIPNSIMKRVGLEEAEVQLLVNDEEIVLTSSSNIIGAFPSELIASLMEQGVDLSLLADDIVERLNENVLEEIEG